MSKLSRQALSAAMRGGTAGWGRVASSTEHVRYGEPLERRPGRRKKCWCGCGGPRTHRGMANGICLTSACELGIARWVKTGNVKPTALVVKVEPAKNATAHTADGQEGV